MVRASKIWHYKKFFLFVWIFWSGYGRCAVYDSGANVTGVRVRTVFVAVMSVVMLFVSASVASAKYPLPANKNPVDWTIKATVKLSDGTMLPIRQGQSAQEGGGMATMGFGLKIIRVAPPLGFVLENVKMADAEIAKVKANTASPKTMGSCRPLTKANPEVIRCLWTQDYNGITSIMFIYDTTVDTRSGDGKMVGFIGLIRRVA